MDGRIFCLGPRGVDGGDREFNHVDLRDRVFDLHSSILARLGCIYGVWTLSSCSFSFFLHFAWLDREICRIHSTTSPLAAIQNFSLVIGTDGSHTCGSGIWTGIKISFPTFM